jgi:hypothetical protein
VVADHPDLRGRYTFFGHLKWTWAIGLGYVAGVATHLAVNGRHFSAMAGG